MPILHALSLWRRSCGILVAALVAGCAQGEADEPPDVAAVEALFQEGEALAAAGGAANLIQATEKFLQVVAMDSTHAPAWIRIARTNQSLGPNMAFLSPDQTLPELRRAAEAAVRYAPDDANAHAALASARVAEWDWPAAEAEFQTALELDAANGMAVRGLTNLLIALGRIEEARLVFDRTPIAPAQGDPYSRYLLTGDDVAAVEAFTQRIAAAGEQPNPNDLFLLAWVHLNEGRFQPAAEALERQIPLMGRDVNDETALLGHVYGRLGRSEDARKALDELDALEQQGRHVSPVHRAWVHLGLEENDQALRLLEQAVAEHAHRAGGGMKYFGATYQPIASDPRFIALLESMRLGG